MTKRKRPSEEPRYSLWTVPPDVELSLAGLKVPKKVSLDREGLKKARSKMGERFKPYRTPVTDAALRQSVG